MKFKDTLGFAVNTLVNRGLRSWLTLLGIVIGISAVVSVVSIVSLGEGLQQSVGQQLGSLGLNTITITPGYSRAAATGGFGSRMGGGFGDQGGSTGGNLTLNDEKILETIPEVLYVNGMVSKRGEVSYLNEKAQVSVQGVRPEVWSKMVTTELAGGRYLPRAMLLQQLLETGLQMVYSASS